MPRRQNEDEFEILDVTGTGGNSKWNQALNKLYSAIEAYPTSSRLTIGGIGGCITGYVAKKVGKSAASAVGGGILVVQIAHKLGYIHIDQRKINRDARLLEERIREEVDQNRSTIEYIMSYSQEFIQNNTPYAVGFASGFFLGLAA